MSYVEIRHHYDNETAEALDIVSTDNPVMAVLINDNGANAFVEDIVAAPSIDIALKHMLLPATYEIRDVREAA